jgi:DNA-binding response OmpR family regulator
MQTTSTLLVDDSPSFLRSAARFLSTDERINVVGVARSGTEALEQVAKLQPQLVIIDLAMPDMNGLEATRRLKEMSPSPHVVILTLHDTTEYRHAALEVNADGFVTKSDFGLHLMPLLESLYVQHVPLPRPEPPSPTPTPNGGSLRLGAQELLAKPVPTIARASARAYLERPPHLANADTASHDAVSKYFFGEERQGDECGGQEHQDSFRVLVVEDEPSIARLMSLNMERLGLEVRVAGDGEQALEDFELFDPHLVLLDIVIPKLDGAQVCRRIREKSGVPILIVTGRDAPHEELSFLSLGADDFIVKPFDVHVLMGRALSALRRAYAYD